MKSLSIFSLISIFNILFLTEQAYSSDWNVEISLDKEEYLIYEPIWLDVELKNISNSTLETIGIPTPNHRGFNVIIKDSKGNSLPYTGIQVSYLGRTVKLVKPNEIEYKPFNLVSSFKFHEYYSDYVAPYGFFSYIPPSTYTVQVELEDETSNVLNFEIKEPEGQELEVLILLDKASTVPAIPENDHFIIPILKELLDKYPNSVYAETCYEVLVLKESSQAISEGKFDWDAYRIQMLRKYPNSGNCVGRLEFLKKYGTKQNFQEFINSYIIKNSNTRAAKYGQFLLLNKKIE